MSKFSDFIKDKPSSSSNENINSQSNNTYKTKSDNTSNSNEKLEDLIDKYSSLDSNSLMQEFIKLTLEKKKRGELSSSEINNLKSMLLPYLNEEQRKNLERLLNVVNNV